MTVTHDVPADGSAGFERVAVPLLQTATGQLEVAASLNGQPARLLVDTGASATVLDAASATRCNALDQSGRDDAVGCAGTTTVTSAMIADLRLAAVRLRDVPVHLIDLSACNAAFEAKGVGRVDGVLGADILAARRAVIDYGLGRLLLLRQIEPS